ncbi:MAG TPA: hypothetical protein ENJ79_08710 [Gammaproteobacteria bacterium]|nr:hypothetical protein [Gammaproteobacteria bacterium]
MEQNTLLFNDLARNGTPIAGVLHRKLTITTRENATQDKGQIRLPAAARAARNGSWIFPPETMENEHRRQGGIQQVLFFDGEPPGSPFFI